MILGLACGLATPSAGAAEELVVFLVRHAEKVDASRDPELSSAGKERAQDLARWLRDSKLDQIHSTDFIRTRDTAGPVADALELQVSIYDPRDLSGFASQLVEERGRHLVVGHSNTTPELVRLLGGDPGDPIDEKLEFDRLYVVTLHNGKASTALLRFGN